MTETTPSPLNNVITIDDDRIKSHLDRVVRGSKRKVEREVRRFPTTTQGLLARAEWLESAGCTHVAMEATGVYWKPVWHILEGRFALILANAAHVKQGKSRVADRAMTVWRTGAWSLQIVKRSDAAGFEVLPKRWIVERTFALISRILARDFERYATTVAAFIRLAMIRSMLRRLAANASS